MWKWVQVKWVSLALLAIIIPASLLLWLRSNEGPKELLIAQTITKEPMNWTMNRPKDYEGYPDPPYIYINEWIKNSHFDDNSMISFSVHATKYYENDPGDPAWGNDYLKLRVAATANITDGFVHSMTIKFSKTDNQSFLHIYLDPDSYTLINIRTGSIQQRSTDKTEAYFEAIGVNRSNNTTLSISSFWVFLDKNKVSHWITITLDTVYFANETYQKVLIPIELGVRKI